MFHVKVSVCKRYIMWLDDLKTPARLFFHKSCFIYLVMLQLRDSPPHFAAKALDRKLLDQFQNICFKLILILGGRGREAVGWDVFGTWCVQRFPENVFYRYNQLHYWPFASTIKWLNRQRTGFIGCFYYVLRLVFAWWTFWSLKSKLNFIESPSPEIVE